MGVIHSRCRITRLNVLWFSVPQNHLTNYQPLKFEVPASAGIGLIESGRHAALGIFKRF